MAKFNDCKILFSISSVCDWHKAWTVPGNLDNKSSCFLKFMFPIFGYKNKKHIHNDSRSAKKLVIFCIRVSGACKISPLRLFDISPVFRYRFQCVLWIWVNVILGRDVKLWFSFAKQWYIDSLAVSWKQSYKLLKFPDFPLRAFISIINTLKPLNFIMARNKKTFRPMS